MTGDKDESGRARVVMRVQFALLLLLPILLVLSHRNIVGLMYLLALAAIFLPGTTGLRPWIAEPFKRGTMHPVVTFAGLFSAYVALATFWSPQPFDIELFLRQPFFWAAAVCLLGEAAVMHRDQAQPLSRVFGWVVVISMLGLGLEAFTGGWLRDITPPEALPARDDIATARGTTIAIMLAFPTVLMASSPHAKMPQALRVTLLALGFCGLTLAAVTFDSSTNAAALAIGLIVGMAAYLLPTLTIAAAALLFVTAMLTAPFLAMMLPPVETLTEIQSAPASWVQRLLVWQFTAQEIFASPGQFLFGGGADYGRVLTEQSGTIMIKQLPVPLDRFPTHPHNIFLHIWLEFGAFGAMLAAAMIGSLGSAIGRYKLPPMIAAAAAGLAAATFIMAYVDASLWTFWRLVAPIFSIYGLVLYCRSTS